MLETKKMNDKEITVSLVLGSGGARGLAHIGVIHWLEEHGYKIESISGSSIGALVGGIYAAGKLDVYAEWLKGINKVNMVALADLSWDKGGLVKGDKIIQTLIAMVGNPNIEDLPIPYTAVASDLINEKEVLFTSGRLFDAIRASISIPMFFTPYKYKGLSLIDGGVLNPLPMAPTFSEHTDITIAVNLFGPGIKTISKNKEFKIVPTSSIQATLTRFISRFQNPNDQKKETDWSVFDVASQALDSMQSTITKQTLLLYPPNFSIDIPRNACGVLEFDRAVEMMNMGYQKAEEVIGKAIHNSVEM